MLLAREAALDGGALADDGIERHRAAVQLDERAHDGKTEPGAAMARALRMRLEPVEHAILHLRRDPGTVVGDREYHGVGMPLGRDGDGGPRRREADRVG